MKLTIKDCPKPFNNLQIMVSGDVRPCCWCGFGVGNLHESTIDEIWNGKIMEELRECIRNGKIHPTCKNAPCPFIQEHTVGHNE